MVIRASMRAQTGELTNAPCVETVTRRTDFAEG